jgi:hypothetical protein
MARTDFARLPADARLWVFGAARPLDARERTELLGLVDRFLDGWKAHGAPLTAARDLREDRFLMVAVDEASVPPSGCSIDAMVNELKQLGDRLGVGLVGSGDVFWRAPSGEVRRAERAEFKRLAEAGEVGPETVVFDTTLTRIERLGDGSFERPARDSWHGRAFFRSARPA